jgi:flagellar hook protein FlgE
MWVRVTVSKAGYTTVSKDAVSITAVATGTLAAGNLWISGYPRVGLKMSNLELSQGFTDLMAGQRGFYMTPAM